MENLKLFCYSKQKFNFLILKYEIIKSSGGRMIHSIAILVNCGSRICMVYCFGNNLVNSILFFFSIIFEVNCNHCDWQPKGIY